MTVKSRKLEQSQATRAALIKTARKLFARVGYAATDIETVARRTRVTRGALYHHFKDKQDLFSAVFDLEEQKLTAIVAQVAGSQAAAFDGMLAGCNAFLDACLDRAVRNAPAARRSICMVSGLRRLADRVDRRLIANAARARAGDGVGNCDS